jgi:hypothetical protein
MTIRHRPRGLQISLTVGIIFGLVLPGATIIALWSGNAVPWDRLPDRPGATWVSIEPIQCLGNPWEEDWLRSNNASAFAYPREWTAQRQIIIDYYSGLGIHIIDARRETPDNAIRCTACSCGAGYFVFLQVSDGDIGAIVALGFEVVR